MAKHETQDVSRRSLLRRAGVTAAVAVPAAIGFSQWSQAHAAKGVARVAASAVAPAQRVTASEQQIARAIMDSKSAFLEIQQDENAHVTYLQKALSSSARPKPTFKGLEQSSATAFVTLSRAFENTGVGAYLLGAGAITDKNNLAAAATILTIEARHSGFLDYISGQPLGPNGAFDKPIAQADIVTAVSPFIASLNGGPDPAGQLKSDTDILNFALLLEFLESEFYNINVPKFASQVANGNG